MNPVRFFALLLTLLISSAAMGAVSISTVPVGNPGNLPMANGVGSVSTIYRIGTYEVTNAQYVDFLNNVDSSGVNSLGLYNVGMTDDIRGGILFNSGATNGLKYQIRPGRQNNPVIFVSWYDAARFTNWLNNGQGNADTETGAYTLQGGTPTPTNGTTVLRNAGATWFLPTESEWAKAAYHKNNGATGDYWIYPTRSNSGPYSDQPPGTDAPDPTNTANLRYNDGLANGYSDGYAVTGSDCCVTIDNTLSDVGAYVNSVGPYGTFDQGGNVREWVSTLTISSGERGLRGGSWAFDSTLMHYLGRTTAPPTLEGADIGFRVAMAVPEPTSSALLFLAAYGCIPRRCRARMLARPRQLSC